MIDIALNDVNKFYGSNHVLKGINLEIYSGEKVGLLGKNGSGKTTLLKIITGAEAFDSGKVFKASGKRTGMSAQIPIFGENDTAEDVLRLSFAEIAEVYAEMKKIEGDADPAVLARYGRLMDRYEALGGYETEVRLDKICSGMHIDARMRKSLFRKLSGGEKSRVNLGRLLLSECDLLLLDEPTNHLDLASLEWLEKFLSDFSGTLAVISHDRIFLDRVAKRIIEIEDGKAHFYSGNYSFYIEEKRRRQTLQSELYERQQKEISRIEERARWFVAQNRYTTKHHAILSRLDHMEKIERPRVSEKLTRGFQNGSRASREIAGFFAVRKSYGKKTLFENIDLKIRRGDRIALVGENGCGKTTLIKMLTGEAEPDGGEATVGSGVKCGYMPQIVAFENPAATVLQTFCAETGDAEARARNTLAAYHFSSEEVFKKVESLSGGEKSRLRLCLLMQKDIDFLLLDEPTNHLDIMSREWIENALSGFQGTMLFVSHDRYFLNKFARKVWSMENSAVSEYDCAFDEYAERRQNASLPKETAERRNRKKIKSAPSPQKAPVAPAETLIGEAEDALKAVNAEIEACFARSDFSQVKALYSKRNEILKRIDELYEKWE